MTQIKVGGGNSLDFITERIRDIEVARNKFVGSTVKSGDNVMDFQVQKVPPKPTLVLKGATPPAGAVRDWSGTMRVEGQSVEVELYRPPVAALSATMLQIGGIQKALNVTEDGRPGPETWNAIEAAILGKTNAAPAPEALADARSEKNIATLMPHVRPYARALVFKCKDHGLTVRVISGTRTFEEQEELWRKGRDAAGKVVDASATVTNARGGQSNHNYGLAFDVGLFRGSVYVTDGDAYAPIGVLGRELGLEWGGLWKSRVDPPHFQLRPDWADGLSERDMIAELRRRYPNGVDQQGKPIA
ncbi:M15 family metallopeptidase [Lysobacter sp. K5869]|uniref:M15 family metallopeptidase n=1 Tax=Lysobacter sp. K5869 TaxID=2820808 RepID=UPI001C06486B|nr:M15 family metallopeptidase [Lysobacter sp. K5869]QWP76682.1 M15 family metallopeptidase [Lysobacter sp. K5869]